MKPVIINSRFKSKYLNTIFVDSDVEFYGAARMESELGLVHTMRRVIATESFKSFTKKNCDMLKEIFIKGPHTQDSNAGYRQASDVAAWKVWPHTRSVVPKKNILILFPKL